MLYASISSFILDIFAKRAQTAHAKTQVELAQYEYLLPRLAGMWTHLERQKGGVNLRGPGETELETDRRIIRQKISRLKEELTQIDKQMATQRKNRGKLVRVSLVGYTNVGKSTIMNLISIEEHFFFTGAKTGKPEYYDLLQEVRAMRGELLKKIIKEYEGEVWCISKHLLAASMRLLEVGTKQHKMGNKEEALDLFQKAYDLYSLFWGVNMKLIKTDDIKKIDDNALNSHDTEKSGFMGKLRVLVRKAIDCCIE